MNKTKTKKQTRCVLLFLAFTWAFIGYEINSPIFECKPVFREKYYFISSRGLLNNNDSVDLRTLSNYDCRELFYLWSTDYRKWHNSLLALQKPSYIQCDTLSFYAKMAISTKFWSVCPSSVIPYLKENNVSFDIHELLHPPKDRVIYLIWRKGSGEITERKKILLQALSYQYDME